MVVISEFVRRMAAAGAPAEAIAIALEAIEQAQEAIKIRRAKNAARMRTVRAQVTHSASTPTAHPPPTYTTPPKKNSEPKKVLRSMHVLHALPADFVLTESDNRYAADRGWSGSKIAAELGRFRDHALARNRKQANWHAAWRNWVSSPYQQTNGNGGFHAANPSGKNVSDVAREMFAEISRREGDDPDGVLPQD